jgi:hypothetical protein
MTAYKDFHVYLYMSEFQESLLGQVLAMVLYVLQVDWTAHEQSLLISGPSPLTSG